MKLTNFLAMMTVAMCAVACSNDDDVKPEYSEKIAGKYNGSMELAVGGDSQGSLEGMAVTIDRVNEDSVNVTLDAFDFGTYSIPEVKAGGKVEMKSSTYAVNGKINVTVGTLNISGDFDGSTNGKTLDMTINFRFGAMPATVVATFAGSQSQNSMTLNTSAYDTWTYVNLKTGKTQTIRDFSAWNYLINNNVVETVAAQGSEDDITIDWHIAIHRYDIRTNGGSAVATTSKVMSEVTSLPTGGYKEDETVENKLIIDMANMMAGKIGYAATAKMNPVLCEWLTKTATGTMPPYIYEPTNLIYVLKNSDGSYAKLKFTDNTNAEGKSGYVTFSYEYVAQ